MLKQSALALKRAKEASSGQKASAKHQERRNQKRTGQHLRRLRLILSLFMHKNDTL
jgi:hypothetical protein